MPATKTRNPGPRNYGPKLEPHQVILGPLVTEKGTHQSTHKNHNAYAFHVNLWATKPEIKKAVEELFSVRVMGVRTLAIYGLPIGLMLAGVLIDRVGFPLTNTLFALVGLLLTVAIGLRWRDVLWQRRRR